MSKANSKKSSAASTPSTLSPSASTGALTNHNSNYIPVGISIGSAYCCAAFFKDGRSQVVANEDGERVTPCCIAFNEKEMFAGTAAKNQWVRNRTNTVIEFTTLLGKKFSEVGEEAKDWAHKIVEKDSLPYFEVEYKEQIVQYSPEDLTAVMLKRMKETTEVYLGVAVKEISLSVPLRATEEYKKALIKSAEMAGLKVTALVKEPVSCLLAFGSGQNPDQYNVDKNILVFDLGGTFLDVSVVSSFGGLFEIIYATHERIGGRDYDRKLTDHFAKEFTRKNKAEISTNAKAISKLRSVSENTRRTLSNSPTAHISVESLHDGIDFHGTINRSMFDMVTGPLTRSCLGIVQSALDETGLTVADIDEVLLVGGGTAMLSVQNLLEAFFPDSKVRKDVAPDESVACGAAYEASLLADDNANLHDQFETKALPTTVGVADGEGNLVPLLRKRCPVPARRKATFNINTEGQTSVLLSIFAGEKKIAKENQHLGDMILTDLPASKEGITIEVSATAEEDGLIKISATETKSKKAVQIVIQAK